MQSEFIPVSTRNDFCNLSMPSVEEFLADLMLYTNDKLKEKKTDWFWDGLEYEESIDSE